MVARHFSATTSGALYEKEDWIISQIACVFNAVSKISRQTRRTSSMLENGGILKAKSNRQVCARGRSMTAIMSNLGPILGQVWTAVGVLFVVKYSIRL